MKLENLFDSKLFLGLMAVASAGVYMARSFGVI